MASRQSEKSSATTLPAPNSGAMCTNPCPMKPAPTTATVSPGWMLQTFSPESTQDQGSIVTAASVEMLSGSLWVSIARCCAVTR